MSDISIDAIVDQKIANHVDEKLPRVVAEQLKHLKQPSPWMTEMQLAEYWQLRNKDDELTTESIRKWTARAPDKHPLPCGNVGDLRRYHRDEVDQWAREEARLQRAKRAAKKAESDNSDKKRHVGHLKAVESVGRK